jgi:hypothetical protein
MSYSKSVGRQEFFYEMQWKSLHQIRLHIKKKKLLFWVLGPFDFLSGISLESKVKDKENLIISLIT